jgi:hypothetical protein
MLLLALTFQKPAFNALLNFLFGSISVFVRGPVNWMFFLGTSYRSSIVSDHALLSLITLAEAA